jgi:MFS family permease
MSSDADGIGGASGMRPMTRVRYGVIFFAMTLAVITYIDRVCMSQAAPAIQEEFGLTDFQKGLLFSAFALAYGIFEIPTGWMGDRFGVRKILMRIVLWWSVFTMLTGCVRGYITMLITRFLFGAGEAGAFPNMTKMFAVWLPQSERTMAQGWIWLAARWGGAFTPLLVIWFLKYYSWRSAFIVFGLLGVVWAAAFWLWYRDDPAQKSKISKSELAILPKPEENVARIPVPWKRILERKDVWLLWFQFFCLNYGACFYITWLPTYLLEHRGATLEKGAFLAGFPLFFGGIGSLVCGYVLAYLVRRMGAAGRARRWMAAAGFTGASAFLAMSAFIGSPTLAMVAMGCSSFCNDLVMPPSWTACSDMGGVFCGTLSGSMNMAGQLANVVMPALTGVMLGTMGCSWPMIICISAGIYFLGAVCWMFIESDRKIEGSVTV